jgi:hypothetical protein
MAPKSGGVSALKAVQAKSIAKLKMGKNKLRVPGAF